MHIQLSKPCIQPNERVIMRTIQIVATLTTIGLKVVNAMCLMKSLGNQA